MPNFYISILFTSPPKIELTTTLQKIIIKTQATGDKDMSKVMGIASKKLARLAEGCIISAKVKELLE